MARLPDNVEINFTVNVDLHTYHKLLGVGRVVEMPCQAYGPAGVGYFSEYDSLVPHDKRSCPACILLPENHHLLYRPEDC